MTALQSVLQGSPEAGEALLGLMSECCDLREFGREVLGLAVNALMSAEADALCGAPRGERSESRVNSRNGHRARSLKTALGDLEPDAPKLGRGTCYPESALSRWSRVEASLAALVVEAYVSGVSTRDMSLLAESLGVSSLSASEVSRLTSELDAQVEGLRSRRLDDQRYCYLWVDATYVRCRVGGRSVSQAVVTAIALGEDGRKRLVGLDCVDTESYADWRAFLASIRSRGLSGLVLCVSDDHAGLVRALAEVFQGAAWQRCTVHLQRNLSAKVRSAKNERLVRELAKAVFAEGDPLGLQGGLRPRLRRRPRRRRAGLRRPAGGGPRGRPAVPVAAQGALEARAHQQRAGEGEPRDQEALPLGAVLPLQGEPPQARGRRHARGGGRLVAPQGLLAGVDGPGLGGPLGPGPRRRAGARHRRGRPQGRGPGGLGG